ncbi:TetR family transcriptional regulator [Sphaerisporangium siamense]|uniref:AcrR family transcriptional regulator n=1 Tax=Sphaerisporangium siamense TaxID=795645 RepID=A0A7W7DBG3_9ACTN|nr:TetR/AcrR family transcriptional regulator [Sphaerisporangium siamense]MBB4703770.1 AcrR family transcriptional regulator [Sphaerisporangium siamense]GII82238.1 TetR family transcriptional regulator [Sphaerisporangium siamense]
MARLTRAQSQERNRAKVLSAAREEFTELGFRDAKIDGIAERAGLTRGAVYSNFPGKRALYFAVLADLAARDAEAPGPEPGRDAREALGAFARAWVGRLPLATDGAHGPAWLGMDLMPEILADERTRRPFAQLMKLDAILLGLALERLRPPGAPLARQVRVAEAALTTLHGATQMAAAAPGFVEPFDVVSVCERLVGLELGGGAPIVPPVPPARPVDRPWSPPREPEPADLVRGERADLTADGVVAILGLHRLEAVEEAVRAAPPGARVTAVMVTGDPGELAPLARLVVAGLCGCLRESFPAAAWPRLRVVPDDSGALAAAAGVAAGDDTETALRVAGGRVVARADGRGACHAAASAPAPDRSRAKRQG